MTGRPTASTLATALLAFALLASSAIRAEGAFFIDWRTLHAANTATLWSGPARENTKFDGDFQRIATTEYLALMTIGGLGGEYARSLVLSAIACDPNAPSPEDWAKIASGGSRLKTPPIVGLSQDSARALALFVALSRSEKPAEVLANIDPSRFAAPEALTGLLYCHSRFSERLNPMMIELTPDLSEDDRVFPLILASRDPEAGPAFIVGRLDSESSWERAVALLALSANPQRQKAGDFQQHATKAVDAVRLGNNWVLPLVAAAVWQAGDRETMRLLDPLVRDPDDMIASFAAIPAGGHWTPDEVTAALDDPQLPQVVKAFMLLGASKRNDEGFSQILLEKGLQSPGTEVRKGAALAIGLRGDPNAVVALRGLFQDASYDVRACAVIAAAMLKTPHAFGVFKSNALDKHHMEVSALASILAAFRHGDGAARIVSEVDEYIFDRERGVALLALALSDPVSFKTKSEEWRKAPSAYLRRYLAIGGLSTGDPVWLRDLLGSISELQDYQPFGTQDPLRKDAVRSLMPEPFSWLLDYCMR